jgi:large subunit ribosomal protein L21
VRRTTERHQRQEPAPEMYAIVKTGGKQYKVAVGDVIDVELLDGDSVDLQPVLVVDGTTVLSSSDDLAKVSVTGNLLGEAKGPKIKILKYKNKTGYKRRVGHRQRYSRLEVTDISK